MRLSDDSFRALARSSPWRWSTLHLRHRDESGEVEAWIRRPDWMLVRSADGSRSVHEGGGRTAAVLSFDTAASPSSSYPLSSGTRQLVWGGGLEPTYRPDGLVEARPDDLLVDYDDPMYGTYLWVAMLDPVELAGGVVLSDLRAQEREGRPTWWARAVPVAGYDPRCSCCPLLWSQVSDDLEYGEGRPRPVPGHPEAYPEAYPKAYDVALDVGTGIVVELRAIGGRRTSDFVVHIEEVDADLTGLVAETRVVTPRG